MKKKTLSLDTLKVKSFVTSFDNKNENTVKGGGGTNNSVGFRVCFEQPISERDCTVYTEFLPC